MAKRTYRRPVSYDSLSSTQMKSLSGQDFHMSEFHGINDDENFVTADQMSFLECNNVYVDGDGQLRQRPPISYFDIITEINQCKQYENLDTKIETVGRITKLTSLDNYLFAFDTNGKIYVRNSQLVDGVTVWYYVGDYDVNSSIDVKIVPWDNIYVIFSNIPANEEGTSGLYGFQIDNGKITRYNTNDLVYVPNQTIESGKDPEQSKNVLTGKLKKTYIYSKGVSFNEQDLIGKTVTISLDGKEYNIEYKEGMKDTFVEKLTSQTFDSLQVSKTKHVYLGLRSTQSNHSLHINPEAYLSFDGRNFNKLNLPNTKYSYNGKEYNGRIYIQLSDDGSTIFAFTTLGNYPDEELPEVGSQDFCLLWKTSATDINWKSIEIKSVLSDSSANTPETHDGYNWYTPSVGNYGSRLQINATDNATTVVHPKYAVQINYDILINQHYKDSSLTSGPNDIDGISHSPSSSACVFIIPADYTFVSEPKLISIQTADGPDIVDEYTPEGYGDNLSSKFIIAAYDEQKGINRFWPCLMTERNVDRVRFVNHNIFVSFKNGNSYFMPVDTTKASIRVESDWVDIENLSIELPSVTYLCKISGYHRFENVEKELLWLENDGKIYSKPEASLIASSNGDKKGVCLSIYDDNLYKVIVAYYYSGSGNVSSSGESRVINFADDKYSIDLSSPTVTDTSNMPDTYRSTLFSFNSLVVPSTSGVYLSTYHNYYDYFTSDTIKGVFVKDDGNFIYLTNNGIYTTELSNQIEIYYSIGSGYSFPWIENNSSVIIEDFITKSIAIGKTLYQSVREKNKIYIPEDTLTELPQEITGLIKLTDSTLGIFTESSTYLYNYEADLSSQLSVNSFTLEKSKLGFGLKKGCDVKYSLDGQYILLPTYKGFTALTYQQFIYTTEQTYLYLSDQISSLYEKWSYDYKRPIKFANYRNWILLYNDTPTLLVFDVRNNSWWKWTMKTPVTSVVENANDVYLYFGGYQKTTSLDFKDTETYKEYDPTTEGVFSFVPVYIKSHKLHFSAPTYYKHIMSFTTIVNRQETYSNIHCTYDMTFYNYRNGNNTKDKEYFKYDADGLIMQLQKVSFIKTNAFQFELKTYEERTNVQFVLSDIVIKYRITEAIR